MNLKKKLLIITLIVFIFLGISCVSASQQNDTALTDDDVLTLGDGEVQTQINEESLSADAGTYSELEEAFKNGGTFDFEKDYVAHDGDSLINIEKSIVIDGHGHSIDAKGLTGIFRTNDVKNISVTLKNLVLKNGHSKYGGAYDIYADIDLTIINCTFIRNQAEYDGGAIYFADGNLQIINSTFNYNGALYNSHDSKGGAIILKGDNQLTLEGCDFNTNDAGMNGGAIYSNGNVSIDDCTFTLNVAGESGGVLYLDNDHSRFTVSNSKFYSNAGTDGGVFFIDDRVITVLENCYFEANVARSIEEVVCGGVIYNNGDGDINLINSTFINNCADPSGITLESMLVDIKGGVVFTAANIFIDGCSFIGNFAEDAGGAIYARGTLKWGENPSIFKDNYVRQGSNIVSKGGAIYAGTFHNNAKGLIFINNNATYGGAVYINNKNEIAFESCYFENNEAYNYDKTDGCGAAIYMDSASSKLSLKNNIFANNNAANDKGVYNCGYYVTIENNWWGVNNPDFEDGYIIEWHRVGSNDKHSDSNPLGIVLKADKNLTSLDTTATLTLQFVDKNGNDFTGKLTILDAVFKSNKLAVFDSKIIGDNKISVDFTPIQAGYHTIAAQIHSQTLSIGMSINGEFDYLQQLIDNAGYVLDLQRDFTYSLGVDTITNGVSINHPLVINGNGHTINALGQSRIFNVILDNVVINNLTFLNGKSDRGGAIRLENVNGVIFNDCNFSNNNAQSGGAIYSNDGNHNSIINCSFTDNRANQGGAIYLLSQNCMIKQSGFYNNNASSGGAIFINYGFCTVSDSRFINNSAKNGGAINFKGNNNTVLNSVFEFNTATESGSAIKWTGNYGTIANSIFLNNKGQSNQFNIINPDVLSITFIGSENYINAIYSSNDLIFSNVTYWNGSVVTGDNPVKSFNESGQDIHIEIYRGTTLVKDFNLTTDENGQVIYHYNELENGNYTLKLSLNTAYYAPIQFSGRFNISRTESAGEVTIDIADKAEFQYGECNITFDISDKNIVRVLITDESGSKIFVDEITDQDYIIVKLDASDDYYNLTVYNIGSDNQNPGKDSRLFKILKNNSTVSINPIGEVAYGNDVTITINGYADLYLIDIRDADNVQKFFNITSENIITVSNLDIGWYNVTVWASGNNIMDSFNSTTFTVLIKDDNIFNVSVSDVIYDDNVTITVKATIDGVYDVNVNSTIVKVNVTNGVGTASILLGAGSYYANVTSNNPNYRNHATNDVFTVEKAKSNVYVNKANLENICRGENVIVYLIDRFSASYNVTIYDEVGYIKYTKKISSNNFTLPDLDLAEYNLTVTNLGNENITGSTFSIKFNVTNNNYVQIYVEDADYGRFVTIYITASADGDYNVDINGTKLTIKVEDRFGSYTDDLNLAAGKYYANVTYDNPYHVNVIENTTFTINKAESNVQIKELGNIAYGNSIVLNYVDDYPAEYKITVFDENDVIVFSTTTRMASVDLTGRLGAGKYMAFVVNLGDENITGMGDSVEFEVYDISAEATGTIVTVSISEGATGNVTLKIDNQTLTQTLENGKAIFNLDNVESGSHDIYLDYTGDANYGPISKNMTICIGKLSIIAGDAKYGWANSINYQVKIVDENGNPKNDVLTTFTINGKTYSTVTDANGIATVKLSLNVGTYSINVSIISGDSVTKKITVVGRLTQSANLNMYYFDGSTYKVKAIGDDGNAVGAGQIVVIKLNKKTYNVKTDKNGIAQLKIPNTVKPGKYTITATYKGQTVKNTIKVKQNLKLKKVNVKKSAKKIVLKATLKNGKKALKGKKVTFKFKNKKIKAKVNKKGIAKVIIKKNVLKKLKVGKKVKYQVTYLKNTVKRTVKVKR